MSQRTAGLLEVFAAALCGAVLSLPFRGGQFSYPVWLVLAPVLWLVVRSITWRWAALLAFAFTFVWTFFSFIFFWHLAAPGVFALALFLSLFYVPALLLIRGLVKGRGVVSAVATVMAVWPLIEIVRASLPVFGFPWLLLGQALAEYPMLRQGADVFGIYGLSAIIAGVNAVLAFVMPAWLPEVWRALPAQRLPAWRAAGIVGAFVLGAYAYGWARVAELAPRLQPGDPIAVIQGNVVQKLGRTDEELTAQLERHLELHRQVIEQAGATKPVLVCWAETMVPGYMNYDIWGVRFKREVAKYGIPTLAGSNYFPPEDAQKPEAEQRTFNTVYLIDGQGREQLRYYKRKLVPFGEYVPFKDSLPFMRWLSSVTRDQYTPGTVDSPLCEVGSYRFGLNICVEDIHPDLSRGCAYAGANCLINVTNDGWFYNNYGPAAHLQAAIWRAIETRRSLLRVTNTGRTVAVDPLGGIELLIPESTEGTTVTRLKLLVPRQNNAEVGVQTLFMRLGEFGVAASLLGVILGLYLVRWFTSGSVEAGHTQSVQ